MRKMLVAMAKDLAGPDHQAGRPTSQHADHRGDAGVEAEAHGPGDPRRLRPARPPPRHAGDEVAARGPRLRHAASQAATPRSSRWWPPAHPSASIYLAQVLEQVRERLARVRIDAEVTGRPKHLYSIYEKMVVKGTRVRRDLRPRRHPGARREAGRLLGRPRASPLHLAAGPGSLQGLHRHAEVQPLPVDPHDGGRTPGQAPRVPDPHPGDAPSGRVRRRCPLGLQGERRAADDSPGCKRIVDWRRTRPTRSSSWRRLKLDLEQDEVYVFTPKGDVITLPTGATPVDFAYSDPHRCRPPLHRGAGQRPACHARLQVCSRATPIEIFTAKVPTAGPSRDWLQFVVTPRARNKIRQWFSRERREDAIDNGRDELSKAMRKESLPVQKLVTSPLLAAGRRDELRRPRSAHAAIGEGHASAQSIAQRLARELRGGDHEEQLPATARQPRRPAGARPRCLRRGSRRHDGAAVALLHAGARRRDRRLRHPGSRRFGPSRRLRRTRSRCRREVPSRMIDVEWDRERPASSSPPSRSRRSTAHVCWPMSPACWPTITSTSSRARSQCGHDRVTTMRFEFELADPAHLDSLLASLKRIDSVYDAYRVLPGKGA